MQSSRSDLADLSHVVAIARHRSLTKAAAEIGVSPSALSHSLKAIEGRLGLRLFDRSNRVVEPTHAGKELIAAIEKPLDAILDAVDGLKRRRPSPIGRIQVGVVADAIPVLLAPVLPTFSARHPDIEIEFAAVGPTHDHPQDGLDALILYGDGAPSSASERLSGDLRRVAAASSDYLKTFGTPGSPADLEAHRGIGVRAPGGRVSPWAFADADGTAYDVAVPYQIIVDDARTAMDLALQGAGLAYGIEPIFAPHVASGALRLVLADHAAAGPGFQVVYPDRRQPHAGVRLLVDLILEAQLVAS